MYLRDYMHKLFHVVDQLSEIEVEINLNLLAIMLLHRLPTSFANFGLQ